MFLKFRAMDAQVRKLTEHVAKVPSEEDFKMWQEAWALEFHKKQSEQHAMLLARMNELQHVAEATRAHLHDVESREGEAQCDGECPGSDDDDNDNDMPEVENVLPAPSVAPVVEQQEASLELVEDSRDADSSEPELEQEEVNVNAPPPSSRARRPRKKVEEQPLPADEVLESSMDLDGDDADESEQDTA